MITSLQNDRVKRVVRLRKGRFRRKSGLFVIDGARELARAVQSGIEIIELFAAPRGESQTEESADAFAQASEAAAEVLPVTASVMRKLCYGERDEGFLAVARAPQRTLAEFDPPANAVIAIIEDVEKPGNIGGIVRTADGAGLHGVIVAGHGTDLFNPNLIRASLGTVFQVPVCTADPNEVLAWLKSRDYQLVTTLVDAPTLYTDVDYCRGTAIILGSEADGLSSHWRASATLEDGQQNFLPVKIPMSGIADSLNVSAAAAVLFYEAHRQRNRD